MNFTTFVSRSSASVLEHLSKTVVERDAVLMFALSANTSNLEQVTSTLRGMATQTIGCLSSPHPAAPDSMLCSIAKFPARDCIPFRSSIPGRPPIQVGRWNRQQESPTTTFELPHFPAKGEDFWKSGTDPKLPLELQGHERDITSLIFFSDDAPEGFMRSLGAVPQANKLGLVASSTPFITGRPFSLFHNQSIYSSGAVGLALRNRLPKSSTSFPGLIPISKPMTVSRSESNLIHELNHANPSKMLVEAIAAESTHQSLSKEEEFFLGRIHSQPGVKDEVSRVYPILSGDPSRGSIALEADTAPQENEIVQFFRRVAHGPGSDPIPHSNNDSIRFLCSPKENIATDYMDEFETRIFHHTFETASENGFMCTEGTFSKSLWKCVVPNASCGLAWK